MKKRIFLLIGGCLMYLAIGLIYAWSIFIKPLEAEFGWNRAETSGIFTTSMIFFCLGGVLSGFLLKKRPPGLILIAAAVLIGGGFFLSSRVESLTGIYLTYGVLCGFGIGLAYNVNISTLIRWFPDKVGLVSGLLLMCFGAGGLLLGARAADMIAAIGFRSTFVLLAVLFIVLLAAASVFWKLPPPEMVFPEKRQKEAVDEGFGIDMDTGRMLRRKSFWLYFIWASVLTGAGLAVIGHAAVCAQDIGASVKQAAGLTGIIALSNGAGRVVVGLIFDRFGRKISAVWSNAGMVLAFALFAGSIAAGSLPLFAAAGVVVGLAYGSVPPTNAAYVNLFYGPKNYALNFSVMNMAIIPGSLLGPMAAGTVKLQTGSYLPAFGAILILSAAVYFLQAAIKRP